MSGTQQISYPPQLPVSQQRGEIADAIRDHQVVIVAGETGSGKTTQLPKICLDLGRGQDKLIGHTQPRRIAARSVAERIAEELAQDGLGTELGDLVGYQVRFTDRTSAASRVKVMTDGILLAELQRDRQLMKYDTIIIDEAHERSLNIDFLLGYLKRLLPRRPDLKLIITSATIDPQRFAAHFADQRGRAAPVIEVSGRTWPVEIRYRPLVEVPDHDDEGETVVRDQTEAIVEAVGELSREGPGDILVFLPGEREIRDTADALAQHASTLEIVPLYSRLSSAEQHRVFARHGSTRRVVLATNVAETSLTVPGIRYVVDSGVARISRYSARTKVQRLPVEPISQASANQRSGRCGRVEAGIAIRLYAEEDFAARSEFTEPEILRTNLASVILQMASLGLGDLARFPFVEPPDKRNIAAGTQLLEELGAVRLTRANGATRSAGPELTKLGRRLARLPIDPRLGRMILEAERLGCVRDVVVIAAALSLQDPRERPADFAAQADQQHARFKDQDSDFMTWLNLWRYLVAQQRELSSSAFRRMCKREYLNYLRVREWQDFESQLRQVCREMKVHIEPAGGSPDSDGIHQALLSGLLSHIGLLEERPKGPPTRGGPRGPREYLGARGARFAIFPGSALKGKNPTFVMAGELVETSRLWARQNAAINPEWAERLGAHLIKRTWSEPHWSTKRVAVMAYERVTLYGVTLVADRLITYGRIDREVSRDLFIRHALVQGEWTTHHRFYAENRRLLEEAEELEHRARRRDIVVDEETLFDFYDARVGADVTSGAHFDQWWKQARREQPELLTFDPSMLTREVAATVSPSDYPANWESDGQAFPINYHFEPGAREDGLTIDLPVATINRLTDADFSWNVPGLRHELVTALIRSLPKQLRVSFVPAPNTARDFLAAVAPGEEPLLDALERFLRATTGVVVPREAWAWDKVDDHLKPTFRVVDETGNEAARGKLLEELKAPLRPEFERAMAEVASDAGVTRSGETTWAFGAIPDSLTHTRAGHEVRAYPGLVDEDDTVGLGVFGSEDEALARHRLGVLKLVTITHRAASGAAVKAALASLSNTQRLALAASPYASVTDLAADVVAASFLDLIDSHPVVRDADSFDALALAATLDLAQLGTALLEVGSVLEAWRATDRALTGRVDLQLLPALSDLTGQLARLVYPGFIADAGLAQLRHYPRYLAAMQVRRERLPSQVAKDRVWQDQVLGLQNAFLHHVAALPPGRPPGEQLRRSRWLLEEFRVSLWAQQLGTAEAVSDQRLRSVLAGVGGPAPPDGSRRGA
jgi:ATP-dependent helicase HrpA